MEKLHNVGQRIREIRERRDLTQERLAELVGTKQTVIARYENGRAVPKDEMLQKISDILLIDVGYLKYGEMYYFSTNDFDYGIDIYLRHMRPVHFYSDPTRNSVTYDYLRLADDFFIETATRFSQSLSKEQKAMILEIMWSMKSENKIVEMKKKPNINAEGLEHIKMIEKGNRTSDPAKVSEELSELDALIDEFE